MEGAKYSICFLVLALAQVYALHCPPSDRIPWIPDGGIDVEDPWESYELPESRCCEEHDPMYTFDAAEKCSLCFDLTKSTPGFAADPNNCAKFYMCEQHDDTWTAYPMMCPNCTFWDQDKLTCVLVDELCLVSVPVPTDDGATAPTQPDEDPEITCINFEDPNILSTNGVYVFNDGVKVVTDPTLCPEGNNCGFFNNSRLEVAFFANNYDGFERLQISFYYKSVGASGNIEGLITNYCGEDPMETNPDASSLYCALEGDKFSTGLKTPPADVVSNVASSAPWMHATMKWDGEQLWLYVRENGPTGTLLDPQPPAVFEGPIHNTHCPLVIGSFIKDAMGSYFNGYMDNICFYKW